MPSEKPTNIDIAAERTICDAATPGPLDFDEEGRGGYNVHASWIGVHQQNDEIEPGVYSMMNKPELAMFDRVEDARLFVRARTLVPALLDALEEERMLKRDAQLQAMDRGASYQAVTAERDALTAQLEAARQERDEANAKLATCKEAHAALIRNYSDVMDEKNALVMRVKQHDSAQAEQARGEKGQSE